MLWFMVSKKTVFIALFSILNIDQIHLVLVIDILTVMNFVHGWDVM